MFLEMEMKPMLMFGKMKLVVIGRNLGVFWDNRKRLILKVIICSQEESMTMSLILNKKESI